MKQMKTLIMVIFGGSGDLTKRKLMPSLYLLFSRKQMPPNFAILGVARTKYTDESYRKHIKGKHRDIKRKSEKVY